MVYYLVMRRSHQQNRPNQKQTSWQKVAPWYNSLVGSEGHYYHEHLILPNVKRLLQLSPNSTLLDIGCGQGVLAHSIDTIKRYQGIDAAPTLIQHARQSITIPDYSFTVADATKALPVKNSFSHATMILSLQNMSSAEAVIKNASKALDPKGTLLIVLNHPAFRIPRQSGWKVDERTKQQSRWINRYNSPLEIPIQMTPGRNTEKVTWSYHHSLQDYAKMLKDAGFVITDLEEWSSDKESVGKAAKMENRARSEFPLFLCIVAQKN